MDRPTSDALETARVAAGLTVTQLWLRYFALGGMTPALEVEAICLGVLSTNPDDYDRIVHALNERFLELGQHFPVPYSADPDLV